MKNLSTKTLTLALLLAAAFAFPAGAAQKKIKTGPEVQSNNFYYLSYAPSTPFVTVSADTLSIMYKDTSSTASGTVQYASVAGLRPVSGTSMLPLAYTNYLNLEVRGDADGSIIAVWGSVSYDGGTSFVTVASFLDTIAADSYEHKNKYSMQAPPGALFVWKLTTTSATDSTLIKSARIYR